MDRQEADRVIAQTIRETMRALVELKSLDERNKTEENADYIFSIIYSRISWRP